MASLLSLPELPYSFTALEPHISAATMSRHYGAHHQGYVNTANRLLEVETTLTGSVERLIVETARDPSRIELFNALAQCWNHAFFWKSMAPDGGGQPVGAIKDRFDKSGGFVQISKKFREHAAALFGSGWVWLVLNRGKLDVRSTTNAGTPIVDGVQPLLVIDLWEHAYYLDYQNRRTAFSDAFLNHLVNWRFANENLALSERKDAYLTRA